MSSVEEHYRRLLAQHYVWMFGIPFEQKVAEQEALLDRVVWLPAALCGGLAIDLGGGPDFQAIALAELGFTPVIAVDTSKELLPELRDRRGSPQPKADKAKREPAGIRGYSVCPRKNLKQRPHSKGH